MNLALRIKICGICDPYQGQAIAQLGATSLGFICVPPSPRYITADRIQAVISGLPRGIDAIGVFADATLKEIAQVLDQAPLTGIQLHGNETPDYCLKLRQIYPHLELIKALRVRSPETLALAQSYAPAVDTILLDAYHPQQLGGTGHAFDWQLLQTFKSPLPWLLAGGLTPQNVMAAINQVQPRGIDLSSGVERSPGDKDLDKVAQLFAAIRQRQAIN